MNLTTKIILGLSSIGFIYLLFKLRITLDKEPPKWMKLFIQQDATKRIKEGK